MPDDNLDDEMPDDDLEVREAVADACVDFVKTNTSIIDLEFLKRHEPSKTQRKEIRFFFESEPARPPIFAPVLRFFAAGPLAENLGPHDRRGPPRSAPVLPPPQAGAGADPKRRGATQPPRQRCVNARTNVTERSDD